MHLSAVNWSWISEFDKVCLHHTVPARPLHTHAHTRMRSIWLSWRARPTCAHVNMTCQTSWCGEYGGRWEAWRSAILAETRLAFPLHSQWWAGEKQATVSRLYICRDAYLILLQYQMSTFHKFCIRSAGKRRLLSLYNNTFNYHYSVHFFDQRILHSLDQSILFWLYRPKIAGSE